MKTVTFVGLLVALLFTLPTAFAQKTETDASDEWMIPLEGARIDGRIKDKAKFLQDKKRYADVEYVQMRSVADAQQNGTLSFKVPGKKRKLRARAVDIRAESKQDYAWNGEFDDYYGTMNVVSVKGQVSAHVSYDGEEYDIYPLEDGIHAVVKVIPPDSTFQGGCGMDAFLASPADSNEYHYEHEYEHDEQGRDGAESSREIGCVERTVRVLVLHTANARRTNIDPQAEAQLAVNEFNQAEINSQVSGNLGRLELAGVAPYNLPGGNERPGLIDDDINDLIGDPTAQALRRQFNADLVVLFTDGNYQDGVNLFFGWAGNYRIVNGRPQIGLIDERSYAIVEIDRARETFTFAHEVGHLFGMLHQTCAENPAGCDDDGTFQHARNFTRPGSIFRRVRRYMTMMHVNRFGYTKVLHFSNPDVTYDTRSTGIVNVADNARQLEVADFTVANYERGGNLTASIDGPTSVNVFSTNTWEAVYSCGNNYTFRWETSDDGFIFNFAGSGETLTYASYNNTSRFYIRLTITSNNGQVVRSFRTVNVNNFRTQDALASKDTSVWQQVIERSEGEGVRLEEAYPNPLVSQTQLSFTLTRPETVSLDIMTLNGQWVKQVTEGSLEAGYHELTLKREGLAAGVYFYRLLVGNEQYARRLVVE